VRINVAIPEAHVDADVLNAALESVTRLNERMLAEGSAPTFEEGLATRGIKWKPEPPGQEHFDHARTVMRRGCGDCDDLAPWQAASLRHTQEDPAAEAVVYRSGPRRWHAVVRRGDGSIDDPSKRAGMGKKVSGVVGAVLPLMPQSSVVGSYIVRPQIAVRRLPQSKLWQARADLPWHWREHLAHDAVKPDDYAMTALHASPVAATALVGALDGICELADCAGFADPDHIDRLEAIAEAIDGATYDELVGEFGEEHAAAAMESVVGFFGGLKKLAKGLARGVSKIAPIAAPIASFVPGGGAAMMALQHGAKLVAPGGRPRAAAAPRAAAFPPPVPPASAYPQPGAYPAGAMNFRCVPF
jgi:hypothetical protein